MTTKPITNDEVSSLRIANLPTRPTAPQEFGGRGYSPTELKAAFDALPMLAIERLNQLIGDISDSGNDSVATEIKTGISANHTLSQFFSDIKSGEAASYIRVLDTSLVGYLLALQEQIDCIYEVLGGMINT